MRALVKDINLQPKSAAEALRVLETVSARLRRAGDPRAAFPDIYAIITRRVVEELERGDGVFLEPAWVSRLAGRFCERYVETLRWTCEAAPQDCEAWEVAYRAGALGATVPVQDVLLGLSAHINYDLAHGIHATIVEFGHADDERMIARYKHDHDKVNALLEASIPEAFEILIERYRCSVSAAVEQVGRRTARRLAMELLQRWRAQVWGVVLDLLRAPGPAEREAVARSAARRAGRIGRAIALPGLLLLAGTAVAAKAVVARSSLRPGRHHASPPALPAAA
jgi:hypothetical protein